jgi:sugar/nucleoside kinase (ribokinase family)
MGYNFVGIGNPVYDIIITPKIRREERVLSGCSTNSCLACRKLGLNNVALIGCIGPDFRERLLEDLKRYGVEAPSIIPSAETGGFRLVYESNGDRTLEVLGVAGSIDINDIPKECLRAKAIVLGPILQEIDLQFVKDLRDRTNALILLDPQGLIRSIDNNRQIVHEVDLSVVRKAIGLVDFVKPNEMESEVITGCNDPYKAAKKLVDWGAKLGLVTLAERGSVAYDGRRHYRIPAFKTDMIDPTGSGDTYAGSFFFEYLRTRNVWRSCLFASAAASIKVENSGPDFPLLEEEIRRRVEVIDRTSKRP